MAAAGSPGRLLTASAYAGGLSSWACDESMNSTSAEMQERTIELSGDWITIIFKIAARVLYRGHTASDNERLIVLLAADNDCAPAKACHPNDDACRLHVRENNLPKMVSE